MIRTYKRKLILTKAQSSRIDSWIGACRVVYNMGLEIRIAHYAATGKLIHKYDLMKQVTDVRKDVEWIRDVPAETFNMVIDRLDKSYNNFFRSNKAGWGFPKFATKRKFKSYQIRDIRVRDGKLVIPKLGEVKIFKDSEIKGVANTATIIKETTGYFICIQCKDVPVSYVSESQAIGLDMGISHFCIDSNGNFIANPKHFKKYEKQLRIENRSLARKKKNSKGWWKQVRKLARFHHKIANVRKDFLHKESTNIAKNNSIVCIEGLNINGMSKNGKLAKHILDAGWGMFQSMLSYKTTVVKIDPRYTSQTCNECGGKDKKSRLSQSEFVCTNCGHISNADVNAAKNILSKGVALSREREPLGCALALESVITGTSVPNKETTVNNL